MPYPEITGSYNSGFGCISLGSFCMFIALGPATNVSTISFAQLTTINGACVASGNADNGGSYVPCYISGASTWDTDEQSSISYTGTGSRALMIFGY